MYPATLGEAQKQAEWVTAFSSLLQLISHLFSLPLPTQILIVK
jgi:hypothetical protein